MAMAARAIGTATLNEAASVANTGIIDIFLNASTSSELPSNRTKIIELLKELEIHGYSISKEQVVFGRTFGEKWPVLEKPGQGNVFLRLAVGNPDSTGIGKMSLLEYLQSLIDFEKRKQDTQVVATTGELSNSGNVSSLAGRATELSLHSSAGSSVLDSFLRAWGSGPVSVSTSSEVVSSLGTLRNLGIFKGNPPEQAANTLTVEQLLNSTLFITQELLCVIVSEQQKILACDIGVTLINDCLMPGCYEHGKGHYSDVPCKNSIKLRLQLIKTHEELIREILPYIRGIPEYVRPS